MYVRYRTIMNTKNRHTFNRFLLHPWIDRLNVSTKPFEGNLRKKKQKDKENNYCVVYRKTKSEQISQLRRSFTLSNAQVLWWKRLSWFRRHIFWWFQLKCFWHIQGPCFNHTLGTRLCVRLFPRGIFWSILGADWWRNKRNHSLHPLQEHLDKIYTNMTNGYKWHH